MGCHGLCVTPTGPTFVIACSDEKLAPLAPPLAPSAPNTHHRAVFGPAGSIGHGYGRNNSLLSWVKPRVLANDLANSFRRFQNSGQNICEEQQLNSAFVLLLFTATWLKGPF